MERQPAVHKDTRSVPNKGSNSGRQNPNNPTGPGYSDYDKDRARQEFRREESEREPWSGSRPEKAELPGDNGQPYPEQVSQTDKTAKYH